MSVVGSKYVITFLLVRGTMSGNESSPCKCPVPEPLCSTTPDPPLQGYVLPPAHLVVFSSISDKMAGLCALALASGGVVLYFDSSSWSVCDTSALCVSLSNTATSLLSYFHFGAWQKNGTMQHSSFSGGCCNRSVL